MMTKQFNKELDYNTKATLRRSQKQKTYHKAKYRKLKSRWKTSK